MICNFHARKTVEQIIRAMKTKGYEVTKVLDEEGYKISLKDLGETEAESVFFSNGANRGWIALVYDNYSNSWDGSDVVSDFGGDVVTMDILEQITDILVH